MIYATEKRANQVAEILNGRYGYPKAKAILTADGWTVKTSYEFGITDPTPEQRRLMKQHGWTVEA
jgi:hypothetical protein